MGDPYTELLRLLGRLHRRHADVVRMELAALGVDDLTPVQAMMLVDIGEGDVSVRDLIERGCYLSTTATYNVRKLIESGYLDQNRAPKDRRLIRLRLTERGRTLKDRIEHSATAGRPAPASAGTGADAGAADGTVRLDGAIAVLRELEHGWFDYLSARRS